MKGEENIALLQDEPVARSIWSWNMDEIRRQRIQVITVTFGLNPT